MKNIYNTIFYFLALMFILPSIALAGWSWHNPSPQGNMLFAMWGSSTNNVFAGGEDGTILHFNGSNWLPMSSGITDSIYDIWGSSANNVFAVGEGGYILHYNGSAWSKALNTPFVSRGIWGSSANDIFAVGAGGGILHYNGSTWSTMHSGTTKHLNDVWGTSANDVFAVGWDGTILHYDGSAWSTMNSNTSTPYLNDVWGSASNNVFAVGTDGTIQHYNGSTWSRMNSGLTGEQAVSVWGSAADNVFVSFSNYGSSQNLLHYDGNTWSIMDSGTTKALQHIWGTASNNVFAMGDDGTLIHYDGSSWSSISSSVTDQPIYGIWGNAANNVYAVGFGGLMLHYDGSTWSTMSSGTSTNLLDIWGSAANNIYTVGNNGVMRHYNGSTWSSISSGTTKHLQKIWGSAANNVFAVGWDGTILHYNGSTWLSMTSGTTRHLESVWGSAANNVFAVGWRGTILHYNGSSWSTIPSGTTDDIHDVWGSAADDVFAVGGASSGHSATILHYDGSAWSPMTPGINQRLETVWGASANNVFAGDNSNILHYNGSTWTLMNAKASSSFTNIHDIWGLDANNVIATGEDGVILNFNGNTLPTFSSFADVIDTVDEDNEVELTFAELQTQGDEADADEVVEAFVVQAVSSGSLKIGTTAATATPFAASSNERIDANNNAYWTPAAHANGTLNAFTVKAQDHFGDLSLIAVQAQVSVTSINDAPAIAAPIPDQNVVLGEIVNIRVIATDALDAPPNTLQYSLQEGPLDATLDAVSGQFIWQAKSTGTSLVTVAVTETDGTPNNLSVSTSFSIISTNSPPVLSHIGNQTLMLGESLRFIASASDAENNPLAYSLIGAPSGATINPFSGAYNWTPLETGDYTMQIHVSDDIANDHEKFTVTVITPPLLNGIPPLNTTVGESVEFTAIASHPQPEPLTYGLNNAPTGVSIDPISGAVQWTPDTSGTFNFSVTATEPTGSLSAEKPVRIAVSKAHTGLELALSSPVILINGDLDIRGRLQRFPDTGEDLSGLPFKLVITPLDGNSFGDSLDLQTRTGGEFSFTNPYEFDHEGQYALQAVFEDDTSFYGSRSQTLQLSVERLAGYALLIQGNKGNDQEGLEAYNKTLNRVYLRMKVRGFKDENIQYLNFNTDQSKLGIDVDGLPTLENITAALADLQQRINAAPAPLYIVAVDHGGADGSFYIDNGHGEHFKPNELATELEQFEAGLNPDALDKPRVIVLGYCYSGSYISSLSKPGRIILSSATENEESYKGPKEPDETRSGEFFVEALFSQLGQGKDLRTAFELATETTETLTRKDSSSQLHPVYLDNAGQHPLLEDNYDARGSNVLSTASGDGLKAANVYLGTPDDTVMAKLAEILNVGRTQYLSVDNNTSSLSAVVNNVSRIADKQITVDIRSPSLTLSSNGTEQTGQLEINALARTVLSPTNGNNFSGHFDEFSEAGKYELLYFANDAQTGDLSPVKRSLVYKNRPGNNNPPKVTLLHPANGVETSTSLIFDWNSVIDPDGEALSYTLIISKSPHFNSGEVYRQEELNLSMTYIDAYAKVDDALNNGRTGLRDGTQYFWKVLAVDPYGGHSESPVASFTTNNTNGLPGMASITPKSALGFEPVNNVNIQLKSSSQPTIFQERGQYNMLLPQGPHNLSINSPGYQSQTVALNVQNKVVQQTVTLIPTGVASVPRQLGTIQFNIAATRINENSGVVELLVSRNGGNDGPISINYETKDGSAKAGQDYIANAGMLIWADQETLMKPIRIMVNNDDVSEGDEAFSVLLHTANPPSVIGMPNQVTIVLADDNNQPPPGGNISSADNIPDENTLLNSDILGVLPPSNTPPTDSQQPIDNTPNSGNTPPTDSQQPIDNIPNSGNTTPTDTQPSTPCDTQATLSNSCNADGQSFVNATITQGARVTNITVSGQVNNNGFIHNLDAQSGSSLRGGVISGIVLNSGTLANFEFQGSRLMGGTLSGNINNTGAGTIENVQLAADAHLINGSISGIISGDPTAPALLENLTVNAGTQLSNVRLAAGIHLNNVSISGIISGDPTNPALLENLIVKENAQLRNVRLGAGVQFEAGIANGENVQFVDSTVIPPATELLGLLPELPETLACGDFVTNLLRPNLAQDMVFQGSGILAAINLISALADNGLALKQDSQFGYLYLLTEEHNFALQPMSIQKTDEISGLHILSPLSIRFVTANGLSIVTQPALQAPCAFADTLQNVIQSVEIQSNGNLNMPFSPDLRVVLRPTIVSRILAEPTVPETGLFIKNTPSGNSFIAHQVFKDKQEKIREQLLYFTPAYPQSLPISTVFEETGRVSFELDGHMYQGMMDFAVKQDKDKAVETLLVSSIGDVNGDSIDDFSLHYPSGEWQTLFGEKHIPTPIQ